MGSRFGYSLLSAAVAMALAIGAAQAAPEGGAGRPENPGGGGQGKPENPGGGGGKPAQPGRGKGGLYSDLVVLNRSVNGLPILSGVPAGTAEEEGEVTDVESVLCLQPITAGVIDDGVDGPIDAYAASLTPLLTNPLTNAADGKQVSPVPLGGTGIAGEECDVAVDYVDYPSEVLFGRLNLGRSPTKVLRQQLDDVTEVLSSATTLSLDEAGRLVADGLPVDSPGQNLAIHAELQKFGVIKAKDQNAITLPMPPVPGYGYLDHAAAALGGAADKGGLVDLDLVVYDNRILGIPDGTSFDTLMGDGLIGEAGEKYYDYSGYSYDRAAKYPGCAIGYFILDGQSAPFSGPLMHFVFDNEPYSGGNVYGFATNADDSRRMIAFVHDNIVTQVDTVGERTEVLCTLVDPRVPQ